MNIDVILCNNTYSFIIVLCRGVFSVERGVEFSIERILERNIERSVNWSGEYREECK